MLTIVAIWAGVTYGIPAAAKQVVFRLPEATNRLLGQEALETLDKALLEPTRHPLCAKPNCAKLFADMTAGLPGADQYRIELRASKVIGPNALALPSGIVVVTDLLVELAKDDHELIAVLAHELGHLKQRHALRSVLQFRHRRITNRRDRRRERGRVDYRHTAHAARAVQLNIHCDFEREADDFAFDYLKQHNIPAESLTALLVRMENKSDASGGAMSYLSSHPATRERAERARAAH